PCAPLRRPSCSSDPARARSPCPAAPCTRPRSTRCAPSPTCSASTRSATGAESQPSRPARPTPPCSAPGHPTTPTHPSATSGPRRSRAPCARSSSCPPTPTSPTSRCAPGRRSRGCRGDAERPRDPRIPGAFSPHVSSVVAARREVVGRERVEVDVAVLVALERAVGREDAVGVPLALRLLGRLNLDVAVLGEARTGRDELTDDDVLLEADQRVALALERRLREDAGRLLERRGRQPRLRRERRLRDAHQL